MGKGRTVAEQLDDPFDGLIEEFERLRLPAGTIIYPAECGFFLPTGENLRNYETGVQQERRDGMPARTRDHMARPQWVATRCRIGGNPHALGPTSSRSFTTGHDVEVVLPETLGVMQDEELIGLSERIMRSIVVLEMRFELEGNAPLEDQPEDQPEGALVIHTIDLSTAGPYGRPTR
jgi:hypothetical protein